MTRFAFAGNIGVFGASGSAAALGLRSAASISCNIPGNSIEALASDRIAVRREGLNVWPTGLLPLFDKHELVTREHRLNEVGDCLPVRILRLRSVRRISIH